MRSSGGYGDRAGWRVLFDPEAWIAVPVLVIVWVVFLSALACAVALVRHTTEHDRYATGKLTLTELTIGIGFDGSVVTEYRDWRGEVESLTRAELMDNADARFARRYLLRTARKGAELGASCGLGAALLCLVVLGRRAWRQSQPPKPEPPVRPSADQPREPASPPPAVERSRGQVAGKYSERSAERRKRDYGRWI